MPAWWTMLGSIITPPIFVVLLAVLWKLLRGVNAVYTVLVYTHERMNALSATVEKLAGSREVASPGSEEDMAAQPAVPRGTAPEPQTPAPAAPRSVAADDEPELFLTPPAGPEQLKEQILTLLRQRSGLRYADLSLELGISLEQVKTLCAELERSGRIGGRSSG